MYNVKVQQTKNTAKFVLNFPSLAYMSKYQRDYKRRHILQNGPLLFTIYCAVLCEEKCLVTERNSKNSFAFFFPPLNYIFQDLYYLQFYKSNYLMAKYSGVKLKNYKKQ